MSYLARYIKHSSALISWVSHYWHICTGPNVTKG